MSELPTSAAVQPAWLALMRTLVEQRHQQPISGSLRTVGEKHSMLHHDVLLLLYHFARTGAGAALEIGAYLGGSTIAIAWGLRDAGAAPAVEQAPGWGWFGGGAKTVPGGRPFASIEPGGQCLDHPKLASTDILHDLRRNLRAREAAPWVTVVPHFSSDKKAVRQVNEMIEPGSAGLFFLDADGEVERDLTLYGDRLRPDCYVVIDDYLGTSNKVESTQAQIEARVADGTLEPLGIYGWGTWVGRRRG